MTTILTKIKSIPVESIITKYTKSEIINEGEWDTLFPCPCCGHENCCKINQENNTIACFGECQKFYLGPIKAIMWILKLEEKEAILKLAEDFQIPLPADLEQEMGEYLKQQRKYAAFTAFAEECHSQLSIEDRQYWTSRGFTDDTINNYKIGLCCGDGKIIAALIDKGFSMAELQEYGLTVATVEFFKSYNNTGDVIPYYTLPNWKGSQVIDIQGRCTVNQEDQRAPKYKNTQGVVESLFNPLALRGKTVVIAEGIPDTLSLLQMGFSACGAYGVGGVKEEWISRLKSRERVFIAYDNDAAGVGSAYKLARRIGENAKIITPPEVKDINELLVKHGTEKASKIIKEIMAQAKTALETDIDALSTKVDEVEESQIKDLTLRILDLSALRQTQYLERLRTHIGITKKETDKIVHDYQEVWARSKEQVQNAEGTEPDEDVLLVPDPIYIRLSQSFALGKVFYANEFQAERKKGGKNYRAGTIRLVTSDRELMPIPQKVSDDPKELIKFEINGQRLILRRPLIKATSNWSKTGTPYSIDKFIHNGVATIDTVGLYKQIEGMFRRYYYTSEEYDYVILSLFTMFTYFYELYDAVPYLYLNGQPETGKSTICILMQHLAFNGDLVSNTTTAAFFRDAEQKQMTLILDEQESIASRRANEERGDFLSIIKDGYKRTGTIKRQSISDSSVTEEFMVFSPMVIANVMGLEDIVKTRTIGIATKAAPKQAISGIKTLHQGDPEFSAECNLIKDQLYCWVMQNHMALRELPALDISALLSNRAGELFQPLFALATFIESNDASNSLNLIDQLNQSLPSKLMRRTTQNRDPIELLREACLEILAAQGVTAAGQFAWVASVTILDKLVEVNEQYMPYMKMSFIGEIITANFLTGAQDKTRREITTAKRDRRTNLPTGEDIEETKKVTFYRLRYEKIAR